MKRQTSAYIPSLPRSSEQERRIKSVKQAGRWMVIGELENGSEFVITTAPTRLEAEALATRDGGKPDNCVRLRVAQNAGAMTSSPRPSCPTS